MTPEQLTRAVAVYGGTTSLAEAIGVLPQTLRRWKSGTWEPPADLARDVIAALTERAAALREQAAACEALARELERLPALSDQNR